MSCWLLQRAARSESSRDRPARSRPVPGRAAAAV